MTDKLDAATIRELLAKIPEGPWFTSFDDAEECGPHSHLGLALVETGRESDWPIARLCEWPQANFIAKSVEIARYALELSDKVETLQEQLRIEHSPTRIKQLLIAKEEQLQQALTETKKLDSQLQSQATELERLRGELESK